MPKICINKSGKTIPIYKNLDLKNKVKIGHIGNLELFTLLGFTDGFYSIGFYSPTGWRLGYTWGNIPSNFTIGAYGPTYRYGKHTAGHKFKILHRQSRIFSGENVVAAVKPGGYIITDGQSSGGTKRPYRLSIKGYIHSGSSKYIAVKNGWCDTDIEIGKCMYNTVTVDGLWV